MAYKAVFFDLDGTLTSLRTHRIPDSTKEALFAARANGVKLFLATGRHPLLFQPNGVVDEFPFDGFLTTNGQMCYNARENIHLQTIVQEDKEALVELLQKEEHPLVFIAQDDVYYNMVNDAVHLGNSLLQFPALPTRDPALCLTQDILALLFYGGEEEQARLMRVLPHCITTRWHSYFTDILPENGGKATGIEAMLRYYGIAREEAMAFGDAQNDLTMLEYVGMGIAMGNAAEEVKRRADHVTDHVESHGIFNAMKHWGVI